jgi:hypothetical protein
MEKGNDNWKKLKNYTAMILFITLVMSVIYVVIKIIVAPSVPDNNLSYQNIKSDYVLMLIQCLFGLVVMTIPIIIENKKSIKIPDGVEIIYFVFLFLAIYLGEVGKFYHIVPHWDTILHVFSGFMLGAMGFSLVNFLNKTERVQLNLSPFFVALFAFCFALAAGAIWEIYEYIIDGLFNLNMQGYASGDGTPLIGRMALSDTMKDIIVDALSALIISIIGYYFIKKSWKEDQQI